MLRRAPRTGYGAEGRVSASHQAGVVRVRPYRGDSGCGVGGVDRVAGMLSELAEEMDPVLLVDAARSASVLWAQRLGFMLEFVGAGDRCGPLKDDVRQRGRNYTRLLPSAPADRSVRSPDWRLLVNSSIEVEA